MQLDTVEKSHFLRQVLARGKTLQVKERCENDMLAFVEHVWPVVEPSRPFIRGWVLEAIADHLRAVTEGHIKRLLINVPPGFTKSLMTDCFWPAWEWGPRNMPSMRYVCFSYSSHLTERDNIRCRNIVQSDRYQSLWGDRVVLNPEQFTKIKFSNKATGWKLATSVGGIGVGERGDRLICLPYNESILTDLGWLPIGLVVEGKYPVQVAGWHDGRLIWQDIEKYERNKLSKKVVVLRFAGGSLRATEDHPIFICDKGWVEAGKVFRGDKVLSLVQDGIPSQVVARREEDLLLSEVPGLGSVGRGREANKVPLHSLREGLPSSSFPSVLDSRWGVLFSLLPRAGQSRSKQPNVGWGRRALRMQALWKRVLSEGGRGASRSLLLQGLSRHCSAYRKTKKDLLAVWQRVYSALEREFVLYSRLQECSAFSTNAGFGEWPVHTWPAPTSVSVRVDDNVSGQDSRARRGVLCPLRYDTGGARKEALCSPHRLRQGQFESQELDHGLPLLSREDARTGAGTKEVEILSVEVDKEPPEIVYNVRVAPAHNYFAEGILVHNCDDPNKTDDMESEAIRNTTKLWFTEVIPDRLNDQKESAIVVIQQRLHREDVSGIALAREMGYTHLEVKMYYEPTTRINGWVPTEEGARVKTFLGGITNLDGKDITFDPEKTEVFWEDPRTEDGELAWPERFSLLTCERLRNDKGPTAWVGQYQQSPKARGGNIIKDEYWQLWEEDKFPNLEYILASLDTAYTEKETNDPSALTIWGLFRESRPLSILRDGRVIDRQGAPRVILLHAWRQWLDFHKLIESVIYCCTTGKDILKDADGLPMRRFAVDRLLIEGKASGISVAQEMMRLYGFSGKFGIEVIDPRKFGDKVARVHAIEHMFSQGLVYAPARRYADLVIEETTNFPNHEHDDLTDSTSMALRYMREIGMLVHNDEYEERETEEMAYKTNLQPLYGGV